MGSQSRKRDATPFMVRVSPEERAAILAIADACSCSVPALFRNLALSHPVKSTLDHKAIETLAALRGDLGRLGGLFKLWLTQDELWAGTGVDKPEIRALVDEIERHKEQLASVMLSL